MSFLISSRSLRHRSGTKEYHLLSIENRDTGNSIIVTRWGKTSTWGQLKVERGSRSQVEKIWNAKTHEKEKGGYEQTRNKTVEVASASEIIKIVGPQYYKNVGADNLKFVDSSLDTNGVKDPVETNWIEKPDGTWAADSAPRKSVPTPPAEESFEDRQARDPLWGMF